MIRQTNNGKIVLVGEIFLFLSLLLTACFFMYAHFAKEYSKKISAPENQQAEEVPIIYEEVTFEDFVTYADSTGIAYPVVFRKETIQVQEKHDIAFALYRTPESKSAVEWFYTHLTGDPDITLAILEFADKNDIPFSLAFSLAYAESRYKATAVHKNENESVDRGVFQLNSNSFPKLTEADFFNPRTSARYGMEHLRFCFDTAGNEVSALAMYNAGTTKVRNDNTPRRTLNYIADILAYRDTLDDLFQTKVAAFFPQF